MNEPLALNVFFKSGLSQAGLGGFSSPVFDPIVNPISTRGADYTYHSTTRPLPRIFRPCDGPANTLSVNTAGYKNRGQLKDMINGLHSKIVLQKQNLFSLEIELDLQNV